MAKFEIFRADLNKVLLTTEQKTDEEAFGAWASAAMVTGFLTMSDRSCIFVRDTEKGSLWNVTSAAGKTFDVEVRAL